jgi:3-phenylpropionate/trans-cinnamate dioxygenase ferredoxin reductase subunit
MKSLSYSRSVIKHQTFAIVGAGLTGTSAAEALRGAGFDGRIALLGDESDLPYERPPLSKQRLRGEIPKEGVLLRNAEFYAINAIELRLGDAVVRVDPAERYVEPARERRLAYDKLLIATGATPRRLTIPGHRLQGIHYLRTLDDCEHIRERLEQQPRVLVVGAGFIGCEVAASARQVGCDVVLVGQGLPLEHVLGHEVGEIYAAYHRSQGIELKTGEAIVEFRGSGRVEEALLSDQTTVSCDLVILGIGVSPSLEVVPKGMELENGIVTDEFCRTSVENIFAAGDVASSWRPRLGRRVRFEHYDNAQLQGSAAGRAMVDKTQPYDPIPFFWSDQFDLGLQYYGYAAAWDTCVLRGMPAEHSFTAFYLRNGHVEAICNVNRSRELSAAKRLLGQTGISAHVLADDGADLAQLALAGAQSGTH